MPNSREEKESIRARILPAEVDKSKIVNCWGPWNCSPEFMAIAKHWEEMRRNEKTLVAKGTTRESLKIGFEKENERSEIRNKIFEEQHEMKLLFLMKDELLAVALDAKVWGPTDTTWTVQPGQRMDGDFLAQYATHEKKLLREILLRYKIAEVQSVK